MSQFLYRTIEVPQDATVLVSFVLRGQEIPKDDKGRFLAQLQMGGPGGGTTSEKMMLFHGGYRGHDDPAKLELRNLLHEGFCINNICSVQDAVQANRYTVRVWLTHNVSDKGMRLQDWGDTGKFIEDLLSYGWSGPKVVDHNDGSMISFGMYGKTIPGYYDRTILKLKVVPAKKKADTIGEPTVSTEAQLMPIAAEKSLSVDPTKAISTASTSLSSPPASSTIGDGVGV